MTERPSLQGIQCRVPSVPQDFSWIENYKLFFYLTIFKRNNHVAKGLSFKLTDKKLDLFRNPCFERQRFCWKKVLQFSLTSKFVHFTERGYHGRYVFQCFAKINFRQWHIQEHIGGIKLSSLFWSFPGQPYNQTKPTIPPFRHNFLTKKQKIKTPEKGYTRKQLTHFSVLSFV